MYIMIALTIFQEYLRRLVSHTSRGTMTQSPNTESTSRHPLWQGCEHHCVNLHLVFSLMLMTPSIVSLALIWLLADTSHKGLVSALTQAESVGSTLRSEAERYNTQVLSPSLKSLNQLYDAVHKTVSEVVLLSSLSYLAPRDRRYPGSQEQQGYRRQS